MTNSAAMLNSHADAMKRAEDVQPIPDNTPQAQAPAIEEAPAEEAPQETAQDAPDDSGGSDDAATDE